MALACVSLIIPAAFISFVSSVENSDIINNDDKKYKEISNLSYGTAIILLIIYILYLLFQVSTTKLMIHDFNSSYRIKYNFLGLLVENSFTIIPRRRGNRR